jgi:hypothetical protein
LNAGMPRASRPYMPGYGIQGPDEGSGLLPWSWAEQRLTASRNYWVTSLWPDGRPHSMPLNGKYGGITADSLAANATIGVRPRWAFGIAHDDFTGSPTRWTFEG